MGRTSRLYWMASGPVPAASTRAAARRPSNGMRTEAAEGFVMTGGSTKSLPERFRRATLRLGSVTPGVSVLPLVDRAAHLVGIRDLVLISS